MPRKHKQDRKEYGSIKPQKPTMQRFDLFAYEQIIVKQKRRKVSQDEALDELLRRAGY